MNIYEILEKLKQFDNEDKLRVSNGGYICDEYGSDRGNYYDMYIGYSKELNYNCYVTVSGLKELLSNALKHGAMIGYKGGCYYIDKDTRVTVGSYGYCGRYITDIRKKSDTVYIMYSTMQEMW